MEERLSVDEIMKKYEHLVHATVNKMFPDKENFCESQGIGVEELTQFGLMGLWYGAKKVYSVDHKRSLKNYMITNIRWGIKRQLYHIGQKQLIHKSKGDVKGNKVSFVSFDNAVKEDDDTTLHELIGGDYNLEGEVVGNVILHTIEKRFTKKPRIADIIRMRLIDGATLQEIGDKYGVTKTRIQQILRKNIAILQEKEIKDVI
jgi:RNA polymerase sigma factor (sigma-70 family)